MKRNNPAVYECQKNPSGLHSWQMLKDGTAKCLNCKIELTKEQADDCFFEHKSIAKLLGYGE